MRKPKNTYIILTGILLLVSVLSLSFGTIYISVLELISHALGQGNPQQLFILMEYRIPRLLLALMVGIGLSLAGTVLQSIIQNPLASPDVIGLSKGAGLLAVSLILLYPESPPGLVPWAALIGAFGFGLVLFLVSLVMRMRPVAMALAGIALSALAGAGIQYLTVKYNTDANVALLWLAGSLWGRSWEHVGLNVLLDDYSCPSRFPYGLTNGFALSWGCCCTRFRDAGSIKPNHSSCTCRCTDGYIRFGCRDDRLCWFISSAHGSYVDWIDA
jgi:ABC-type Fe3+-siderophore transport system permease subunit